MTNKTETITATDLQAKFEAINTSGGTVVSVFHHPYETDGLGAKLIVVWTQP